MDYKKALGLHVFFEKDVKPIILENLEYHQRNIAHARQIVNETRRQNLQDEESAEYIKVYLGELKFSLTGAKCYTHMHNKDYENGVKYYELFKILCYKRIEEIETIIKFLSQLKNVSVILKAGRKMNKRKNKNNKA